MILKTESGSVVGVFYNGSPRETVVAVINELSPEDKEFLGLKPDETVK